TFGPGEQYKDKAGAYTEYAPALFYFVLRAEYSARQMGGWGTGPPDWPLPAYPRGLPSLLKRRRKACSVAGMTASRITSCTTASAPPTRPTVSASRPHTGSMPSADRGSIT